MEIRITDDFKVIKDSVSYTLMRKDTEPNHKQDWVVVGYYGLSHLDQAVQRVIDLTTDQEDLKDYIKEYKRVQETIVNEFHGK